MTADELVPVEGALAEWRPPAALTVTDAINQIEAARRFVATQLVEGVDYGRIPGCGPKPALFQPGAEKLRLYFNLAVASERTHYERAAAGECEFAYRVTVTASTGAVVGDREAWASSAEQTFRNRSGQLTATKNTIAQRAEKRAFVAAVRQATGLSDLFTIDDGGAPLLLDDRQQAIIAAIVAHAKPDIAAGTIAQARRTRAEHWEPYLRSAIDSIPSIDDDQRDELFTRLSADEATAATVKELLG